MRESRSHWGLQLVCALASFLHQQTDSNFLFSHMLQQPKRCRLFFSRLPPARGSFGIRRGSLDVPRACSGSFGELFGVTGGLPGHPGEVHGGPWELLGGSLGILGCPWGVPGGTWGVLGVLWEFPGRYLGGSGGGLGAHWGSVGAPVDSLRTIWGAQIGPWARTGDFWVSSKKHCVFVVFLRYSPPRDAQEPSLEHPWAL